jgi:protein-tyrosine phosphatase
MRAGAPLLTSVVNFRDIGGYATADGRRVRTGRVFRSGALMGISDADLAALEALPIRTVIDLRTRDDLDAAAPGRLPAGARRVSVPMGDPSTITADLRALIFAADALAARERLGAGQAEQMMVAAATGLALERTREYAQLVRALLRPAALPALVHCSAGKDRTGWAASILLLAAGVPEPDVIEHYVLSNAYRRDENARVLAALPAGLDPDWLRPFFEVREAYAQAALDALRARFGGVEGYLREGLGLAAGEVEQLRTLLLD